jgi:Tol biopolymer transport system component
VDVRPEDSPDSKWLAYGSSETGSYEIFIESVIPGEGRWRVSAESGLWPTWSPSGDRLYYLSLSGELLATEVEYATEGLRLGHTEVITNETQVSSYFNTYDLDPVTGRVFMERPTAQIQHSRLALVTS